MSKKDRSLATGARPFLIATCTAAALLIIAGCSTTQVIKANSTPAEQATEFDPAASIDIGIMPLEPGIPTDDRKLEASLIVPDVRLAESRFIAYHLKDTLEKTGNWGAVRVTPGDAEFVHLTITGEILESDGEELRAKIKATDATGRVWLKRSYKDAASKFSYQLPQEDAFQDFYNDIANDLLEARRQMSKGDIAEVREVAALRYASSLAPDAFSSYYSVVNDRVIVHQLPAANDPMMKRIERIKDRDYLFVDTLDDFYGQFYRKMQAPYTEWRFYTYDEAIKLDRVKGESTKRLLGSAALIAGGLYAGQKSGTYVGQAGAVSSVIGGVGLLKSGLARRKEAEIHAESLKELSSSLGAEITPIILEVEGRNVELSGSADSQYTEWRRILREIYAEETGLPAQ